MSNERINVTRTFLPPLEEYEAYIKQIWSTGQLTNRGPLLQRFEGQVKDYLGVENFQLVSSGTMALQIALHALGLTEGEVITTPFTYVATTSSILWERCSPVFVDIDPSTLCIDVDKIEAAITPKTRAIMPVHVFGNACDIEKIAAIAKKHNLKVIYDGAHAFGVEYKGKSLLDHGDISICSFHATKAFHTIEGGGLIIKDSAVSEKVRLIRAFGHDGDNHYMLGINAKASEFQAAMGLCNLKYVDRIIEARKKLSGLYDQFLNGKVPTPALHKELKYNYAYYPVLFGNEDKLLEAMDALAKESIFPRRYFYPSLNTLPYLRTIQRCPISESISRRIVCLPLYVGLEETIIHKICEVINR